MSDNLNSVSSADAALNVVASTLLAFALPVIDEFEADSLRPLFILVTKSDFEVSSDLLNVRPTPVTFGAVAVVKFTAVPFRCITKSGSYFKCIFVHFNNKIGCASGT